MRAFRNVTVSVWIACVLVVLFAGSAAANVVPFKGSAVGQDVSVTFEEAGIHIVAQARGTGTGLADLSRRSTTSSLTTSSTLRVQRPSPQPMVAKSSSTSKEPSLVLRAKYFPFLIQAHSPSQEERDGLTRSAVPAPSMESTMGQDCSVWDSPVTDCSVMANDCDNRVARDWTPNTACSRRRVVVSAAADASR